MNKKNNTQDLKEKYMQQINNQFKGRRRDSDFAIPELESSEYIQFKKENEVAHFGFYEKYCNLAESISPIAPDKKDVDQIQEDIETIHLNVTPTGVTSFGILAPVFFIFVSGSISFFIFQDIFIMFMFIMIGGSMIPPLTKLPSFLAQVWRMKASGQMILSVFYIVTYMRHTSNLERAISFASEHLSAPLSTDLRKIVWDVETKKYNSIYDSAESYLEKWRPYNSEFVESMHLVIGSLYETSETKRQDLLDKSLDLILQETYDKMLHYAHNLQSPITALHMLGIVLPILGLIILPLMVNFMPEVKWYYIMMFYNIVLPAIIYYMGKRILAKRPSGGGGVEINMNNPYVQSLTHSTVEFGGKETGISPKAFLITVLSIFLILGFSPILLHLAGIPDIGFTPGGDDFKPEEGLSPCGDQYCFLGYKETVDSNNNPITIGPFGLGSTLISLLVPFALAVAFGVFFSTRSKKLIKLRDETKELENEFVGALFQLGNRLGDGLPPEMAFQRVATTMPNSKSGDFFRLISTNISKLGMGLNQAIFDPKVGALIYYPSTLIESSMKILTQSAQKGPKVAANAIENVARYIREMGRVNERLADLMAEVISSMKSQINFLTPIISGIVIGITSMITAILQQLSGTLGNADSAEVAGGQGATDGIMQMFGDGIPTFYFQIIVGVYVVQVVYLLSALVNSIQNGVDPVSEDFIVGKNLIKSTLIYLGVSFVVILAFNIIAASILGDLG